NLRTHQDLAFPSGLAITRGAVHRITDDGILESIQRADKTVKDFARMDADPHLASNVTASGAHLGRGTNGVLNSHRRPDRFLSMLNIRLGASEHRKHRISHELIHDP